MVARMVPAVIVGFMASAIVVGAFIEYGVPFLVANARAVVGVAAGVAVMVALDRWQRPWFVELQRQGSLMPRGASGACGGGGGAAG